MGEGVARQRDRLTRNCAVRGSTTCPVSTWLLLMLLLHIHGADAESQATLGIRADCDTIMHHVVDSDAVIDGDQQIGAQLGRCISVCGGSLAVC